MSVVASIERERDYGAFTEEAPLVTIEGRGRLGIECLDADQVPGLSERRQAARQAARDRLEANMEHLRQGEFDVVPAPVDALGTARQVVAAEGVYGYQSSAALYRFEGLVTDCWRLLAEAYRKNAAEYFPPVAYDRDPETGAYFYHGQSLRALTDNALTPIAEEEEQDRRVNESVEEHTYEFLGEEAGADEIFVVTLSPCTDWAIAAYERNPKAGCGGYVPSVEKLMARGVAFASADQKRHEEQIGMPGLIHDERVLNRTLEIVGMKDPLSEPLDKTALHGTQLLFKREQFPNGIIDFAQLLDTTAAEIYGGNYFLGEPVAPSAAKNYLAFREQAALRQESLKDRAVEVARYTMSLARQGVDAYIAEGLVEQLVKKQLFDIARAAPETAAIIFDQATARNIQRIAQLESVGRWNDARLLAEESFDKAPSPGYCGAGSCGLEGVSRSSEVSEELERLGLDVKGGGILHDTERRCPSCQQKKVYYDSNSSKACRGCGKAEIKKRIKS